MTPASDATRLTVQYRAKQGKIYELTCAGCVLAVHITPPEDAAVSGDWHVEARLGSLPGPSLVDGWGPTAKEALRQVERAWRAHTPSLEAFNWDAVVHELSAVRAL
jgi:hypothetical protein